LYWLKGVGAVEKVSVVVGTVETSMGTFEAIITDRGLARLTLPGESSDGSQNWLKRWMPHADVELGGEASLHELAGQINAYLLGELQNFSLTLDLRGTLFQSKVWEALRKIPYGETRSYADIAATIGQPQAVRAVGRANGLNPVPIIVPCHRVVGSDGRLVGYAGGLEMKQMLLDLEAGRIPSAAF
jgi:methylated-DNA-[protein]-cysteine S-methyltransferase